MKNIFVSDKERKELKYLYPSIRKGLKDAKEGKYRIVEEIKKSHVESK